MHDIFDEAIGASPPSRVDIDAIVGRRRRRTALRSGATLAGAGVVAAAVITAIVVNTPGPAAGPRGGLPVGAGQAPPSPAALPSRPPETAQEVQQRLSTTLTGALTAALPGAGISDRVTKASGIRVYPDLGGMGAYQSSARLTTSAGSGTFNSVSAPRPKATPAATPTGPITDRPNPPTTCEEFWAASQTAPAHPDDRQCALSTGPDGQVALAGIDRLDSQAIRYEVVVLWADCYVDVTLENYFEGWQDEGDPPDQTFLPAPQLTLDQLTALAENPALGV
jgi:hypothetical protein